MDWGRGIADDIAPAKALGLDTVWIRRNQDATRMVEAQPTWRYPTLADFADAMFEDSQ
ncbi:MAG: hypothetical protein OXC98_05765 [bacterium]|nr:hypothetical protein [Acidimicrobiia bacterium]MCY4649857.1 hypothetical protein [bacterium]